MKEILVNITNIIDKIFEIFEKYITSIALITFTIIIFSNIVGRYVFLKGFPWAEEASRFLNVWLVFLAISAGLKYKAHIGVDAIVNLCLPKKSHRVMSIIVNVIVFLFSAVIAYHGFFLVDKIADMNQKSAALQIPMQIPYLAIPVGMAMLSIRAILEIIKELLLNDIREEL